MVASTSFMHFQRHLIDSYNFIKLSMSLITIRVEKIKKIMENRGYILSGGNPSQMWAPNHSHDTDQKFQWIMTSKEKR